MSDRKGRSSAPGITSRQGIVTAAVFAVALAALLAAAWLAYRPGIAGVFLLDDFSNLQPLGTWGPVTHWDAFWRYVTAGIADPTGRPLGLLSFLLDARDWPAPAVPFKVTNILLHLMNGALLCWAMLKLARRRGIDETRAATAALIGAGIWLLHPLFVSTTLYVVQREAMLPATFTFIGFICWCSGRDAFDGGRTCRAIAWMLTGAWLCTLLATLCKANGFLLPLLLVMAEATVLRATSPERAQNIGTRRGITASLLGLPIILLAVYLTYILPSLIRTTPGIRGWSVGQRLLSEPRILTDYLRWLWIPQTTSSGVFTDQIRVSSGWLQPWTTLPCIVLVGGLIVAGWQVRRRLPLVAFAILFFFAGQALESSFVPLKLAFEHRNYLPAAFMFWPVGMWVSTSKMRPLAARLAAVALLCLLAAMTWARAGVWGNLQMQARLWGHINPDSPQAQAFSATAEAASGNPQAAVARLRSAAMRMPGQPQVALMLVGTECRQDAVNPQTWPMVAYSLQHAHSEWNNIANWFLTSIPDATSHRCDGMNLEHLQQSFAALKSNPAFLRWHRHDRAFQRVEAVFDMATGQPQRAITIFNDLLADGPRLSSVLEQAKSLNAFGYPDLALRHLEAHASPPPSAGHGIGMARIHAWVLHDQRWWPRQIDAFRQTLQADAHARATTQIRKSPVE